MSVQIKIGFGAKATQVNKLDGKRVKVNFSGMGKREGIGLGRRLTMLKTGRITRKGIDKKVELE